MSYVQADKKRPYKMYAGMLSAFITSLITANLDWPPIVLAVGAATVASLAVYLVPNPLVSTKKKAQLPYGN